MQKQFTIRTNGVGFYEFTSDIAAWIAQNNVADGIVTLFIRHTSASLLIQENADPDVQRDLLNWLNRFAPPADHPSMSYLTHRAEGPDDMPAHIKASVLPSSLSIPVLHGQMTLGTWQGVYLIEHRTRPHMRSVVAHIA
ncbi:MAG: secondary thiamine-phosphate synthase enzyme YjbQ [Pseudomonadota bacterium]